MQVHKVNGIDSPRAQAVHSVSRIWIYFAFADPDPPKIRRVRKKKRTRSEPNTDRFRSKMVQICGQNRKDQELN